MHGKSSRTKFLCIDCKKDTGRIEEYYMLKDEVWIQVHDSKYGMFCIGCFEQRLKRKLTKEDFNNSFVNSLNFDKKSMRLLNRLTT